MPGLESKPRPHTWEVASLPTRPTTTFSPATSLVSSWKKCVVKPNAQNGNTRLCMVHSNIDMKLSALHTANILTYNNDQELLEDLCYDRYNEDCLARSCHACGNKNPKYMAFDNRKVIKCGFLFTFKTVPWCLKQSPVMIFWKIANNSENRYKFSGPPCLTK